MFDRLIREANIFELVDDVKMIARIMKGYSQYNNQMPDEIMIKAFLQLNNLLVAYKDQVKYSIKDINEILAAVEKKGAFEAEYAFELVNDFMKHVQKRLQWIMKDQQVLEQYYRDQSYLLLTISKL